MRVIMAANLMLKRGDIISEYSEEPNVIIVQQNNCTAVYVNPYSFAGKLAVALPYSNPYCERSPGNYRNLAKIECRPSLGSITLKRHDNHHPIVCCFFAQYKMGSPNFDYYRNANDLDSDYLNISDTVDDRLQHFETCLFKLLNEIKTNDSIRHVEKIIFPYEIGCNRGGGNWDDYLNKIKTFASMLYNINSNMGVEIVKFNNVVKFDNVKKRRYG